MTVKSPQTYDNDIPPIPSLKFVKGKVGDSTKTTEREDICDKAELSPTEVTHGSNKEKAGTRKKAMSKTKPIVQIEQSIYDGYSTQLRNDLLRKLKRLKNAREEAKHPISTIKQFFEQAIVARLDTFEEVSVTSDENAERTSASHSYSPFRTEIRRDLLRRVKRWKYDQEERGYRNATIKSFLESAIVPWLAKQT